MSDMGRCPDCRRDPCTDYPVDSPWWQAYAEVMGYPPITDDVVMGMTLSLRRTDGS